MPEVGRTNILCTIGAWQEKWRLSREPPGQGSTDIWAGIFRVSEDVFQRLDYGFDVSQTPEALANGRFTGWDRAGFVTVSVGDLYRTADQLLFVVHDGDGDWWENMAERFGEPRPEVAATVWIIPDDVADRIEHSGRVEFDKLAEEALAHRRLYWDGVSIVARDHPATG